ncbi:uncharacterized protein LOC110686781 [Chenopodium quinoa]|uniref:uncharacterized protein LOC110686781 n=1 Tax=Chenopodium quinoa TaxID=63459 RepID=UPI000B76C7B9|nr:uncharacterized protein LOC110686781 [Chenopodium quinoa]
MIIKEISSEDQLHHSSPASMFRGIKILPENSVVFESQCDMTTLNLDFHGSQDIVFSLSVSRGVHLAGYLYDDIPSPTNFVSLPIVDNGGSGIQQKESMLSIKIPGLGKIHYFYKLLCDNNITKNM